MVKVHRHIFLLGFMGSGKSTVGPLLAQRLGLPFSDLDECIEAQQRTTIADIFARCGESFFRGLETNALAEVAGGPPCVLALGGGALIRSRNRNLIRDRGITIWLKAPLDLAWKRCSETPEERPLAKDRRRFEDLFLQRREYYEEALIHVEVGGKSPRLIVAEIEEELSRF